MTLGPKTSTDISVVCYISNRLHIFVLHVLILPLILQTWICHQHQSLAFSVNVNTNTDAAVSNGKDSNVIIDLNIGNRRSSSSLQHPRIVIVGAGVGGLATAARIATQVPTAEITVLEKNGFDKVGGRCGSFTVDIDGVGSFRHERGPSLLLLKEEYETLFAECCPTTTTTTTTATTASTTSSDETATETASQAYGLTMRQCIPAYQVVFDDGDTVSLGFPRSKCTSTTSSLTVEDIKQIQILEQQSIAKFNSLETNGFMKWTDYLNTCSAYLDCGLPNFIENKLHLPSFPSFLYESLRENGKRWPLQPHSSMLANIFTSPKMIALASFQDLYVGLEPYTNSKQLGGGILKKTAPAVFGLLAAIELHPTNSRAGVYAPIGGFAQVANSMYRLCMDRNVTFQFHTSVTSIAEEGRVHFLVKKDNRRSKGEKAEEEAEADCTSRKGFLDADLIICNADLPYATETIMRSSSKENIKEEENALYHETYDWNDNFDYSSGVIAFHWSVSKTLDALETHNVFLSANSSSDGVKSWAVLRNDNDEPSTIGTVPNSMNDKPFNFYVHRARKTDSTACPRGCDSIMILVPCATLMRKEDLASLSRDKAIEVYKQQFSKDVVEDVREAVLKRLSVLNGLENVRDSILHEVVDTPGSYADYYNVGAGVPFGLVSIEFSSDVTPMVVLFICTS